MSRESAAARQLRFRALLVVEAWRDWLAAGRRVDAVQTNAGLLRLGETVEAMAQAMGV